MTNSFASPNLSAFHRAGGKLILWQGWADEKVSPFGTVSYYKPSSISPRGFLPARGSPGYT
jgi:hypothetical protein